MKGLVSDLHAATFATSVTIWLAARSVVFADAGFDFLVLAAVTLSHGYLALLRMSFSLMYIWCG